MTTDEAATGSNVPTSSWKGDVGCLLTVVLMLCVVSTALAFVSGAAMDFREDLAPWFARYACHASGCGRLVMAAIGWTVWAAAVGVVAVLGIFYRRHRWLFFLFLLPAAGLVLPTWLLSDARHYADIEDLVTGIPNGDALAIGLNCGSSGGWVVLLIVGVAGVMMKTCPPRTVWAWQLARLVAPAMMLPALVIALVLA